MSSGRKALIIIIFLILLALSGFRFYYYATHGEEFFPSMIKRWLRPPEETPEIVEVIPTTKLTVNPNYDGTNKEYIYSDSSDEEAVTRIHQTVVYQYYDNSGDAIKTVETKVFNASGETLFSGYMRERCKMPDTNTTRQEIEILYRYEEDKIFREYTISSFNGSELLNIDTNTSEKNRT